MKIFLVIILIIFAITLVVLALQYNEDKVKEWANQKGTIIRFDQHFTTIGTPFYYLNHGGIIYEVEIQLPTGEHETWFIRTGNLLGFDYEKK